jgi:hypothetical protein
MTYRVENGRVVKKSKKAKVVASDLKGYKPDAGLNSAEGLNHYWFSVTELVAEISKSMGCRGYDMAGQTYVEVNATVDIMDQEGRDHLAPQQKSGYYATFRFTPAQLAEMAGEINKGAQCVRVTGRPAEVETTQQGERFRIIAVDSSWSAGNHAGHMVYMVMTSGEMIQTDSTRVAAEFLRIAQDAVARQAQGTEGVA